MNLLQKLLLFLLFVNPAKTVAGAWFFCYSMLILSFASYDSSYYFATGPYLLSLPYFFFYAQSRKITAQTELKNQDPARYDNHPVVTSVVNLANSTQQSMNLLIEQSKPARPNRLLESKIKACEYRLRVFNDRKNTIYTEVKDLEESRLCSDIKEFSEIQIISAFSFVACGIIGYAHLKNRSYFR